MPGEPVTVVDLGGSILFSVLPEQGRRLRPARLEPDAPSLTVPIRVVPSRRCEAHTRGNTSQPFLFSVFTRTGDGAVHRTITPPDKPTQLRLWDLLDRYCASTRADRPSAEVSRRSLRSLLNSESTPGGCVR